MTDRRRAVLASLLALLLLPGALHGGEADELKEARAVFERNLDAIRHRDRAGYLACYLDATTLARTGPKGMSLGFADLAREAGEAWPDPFVAEDLRLVRVAKGIVYGTYRYRVRFGSEEHVGLSERIFVETPAGWKIAVTSAFEAPPGTPPPPRALVGATLVDGTGATPVRDAVVVLRDGLVDCAGSRASCPVPEGISVTDVAGAWITPGLVDAHVHFSQTGWADGRPDAFDVRARYPYEEVEAGLKKDPGRFLRSYACSGVTSVFDVGGYPWTLRLPGRAEAQPEAPRVVAAGPLLATIDFWLNLPAERQFLYLKDEASGRAGVRYLAGEGARAIKVWYIVTPDRPVEASAAAVLAAGDEARKRNLPLIVHATGLAEAKTAVRAGAKLLVHGVLDRPVDDELLEIMKKGGTIYCPTQTVLSGYVRIAESIATRTAPAVDDPNGCVDPTTRAHLAATASLETGATTQKVAERAARTAEREAIAAANLKRVRDAGIPIAMGTDAGNPGTLHGVSVYAEMEAMQAAGLTPMEVLVASTRGGSLALGLEKEIGTVEKGKRADLLVLDADPTASASAFRKLRSVVRGGVMRSVRELAAAAAKP